MNKKVGTWSLRRLAVVFMLLLTISSSVVSVLTPSIASADTASDITAANKKFYAGIFLRDCLDQMKPVGGVDMRDTILRTKVKDPATMFTGGTDTGIFAGYDNLSVHIGTIYKSDDGIAKCRDGTIVGQALNDFGMYAQDFMISVGYKLDTQTISVPDDPNCSGSYCNGRHDVPGAEVYSLHGAAPDFTYVNSKLKQLDYQKYAAYLAIFNANCRLTIPPTGTGEAVTYRKAVQKSDGTFDTQDVPAEFVITKTESSGDGSSVSGGTTTITVNAGDNPIKNYDYNGKDSKCRDLLAELNKLVPAVVAYNTKNQKDPISTEYTYKGAGDGGAVITDPNTTTCAITGGLGWIVCPVMNFIANVNDGLYNFISGILVIPADGIFSNQASKGAHDAWNMFRGYANILFIVAFLIIIYSQVTSVGITNYGVKKLLPKLIVAAVLVNTSYYVCQIAVDLSNILGVGIKMLFDATGGGLSSTSTAAQASPVWANAIAAILILGAGVIFLVLAISVPVLLAAFLALASAALILIVRQALVVLLIVVSPVAFVLWLLPNTQKWFKKWWEMFFAMLMLYPIISALFGGGALAAAILGKIDMGNEWISKIAALGAAALPLFAIMPILQGALKTTGALGTTLSGFSKKANARVGNKVKTESKLGRGWTAAMANRTQKRATRQSNAIAKNGLYSGLAGVAGGKGYKDTLADRAEEAANKEHAEVVARTMAGFTGMKEQAIRDIATDPTKGVAQRQAAISHLLQKGDHDSKIIAMTAAGTVGIGADGKVTRDGQRARDAISDEYAKSDLSNLFGKHAAKSVRENETGGNPLDMGKELQGNYGNIAPQTIAGNKNYAKSVVAAYGSANDAQKAQIDKTLDKILNTPQIAGSMAADTDQVLSGIDPVTGAVSNGIAHYRAEKARVEAAAAAAAAAGTTPPPATPPTPPPAAPTP